MDREMRRKSQKHCSRLRTPALLLFLLLLAEGIALANQIQVGLHAGLSMPNIRGGTGIYSQGFRSRTGPYFGLFADFQFETHFSLRAEINYASQGGKRDGIQPITINLPGLMLPPGTILYADFFNEAILDYIEIPVLLELSWGEKPHFFMNAGPYVGFLIKAKTVTSGMSSIYLDPGGGFPLLLPPAYQPLPPVSFDATTDVKKDINDINAGVAGGAGVSIRLGPGDIVAAFHFSWGMTNIQKNAAVYGEDQTGAIVFTLGYALALKRGK